MRSILVVSVDVGSAGRVVDAVRGVPISKGPGIVLVSNDIDTVRGVLVVPVNVGPDIIPVGRVVGTVCDIPVNTGPDVVPVSREVDGSQQPPSIMTDLCPTPRLLVA